MRKLLFSLLMISLVLHVYAQAPRALDQPMKAKSCVIKIEANAFVARTYVELEYENTKEIEIEGVEYFSLRPGQVITAFQLDLQGKFRDGSIEEKWKASNAYNSIVGKRVDPALLQMQGDDHYRLNIYPFTPRGTRKITFTIVEILKPFETKLLYELPLNFFDSVEKLYVDVKVNGGKLYPRVENGILRGHFFNRVAAVSSLSYEAVKPGLKQNLQFSIALNENDEHLITGTSGKKFALRLFHDVPRYYSNQQDKVAVFWDISSSAHLRDIEKEINFLRNYVYQNGIKEIELYSFNNSLDFRSNFNVGAGGFTKVEQLLRRLEFSGSTDIGVLDFSTLQSPTALVFSDAMHTRGNKEVKQGSAQVHWVISTASYNIVIPKKITEWSGGTVINLGSKRVDSAVYFSRMGEQMLYKVSSNGKNINIDQSLPIKGQQVFVTGEYPGQVQLSFGNNLMTTKTYHFHSPQMNDTALKTMELLEMLNAYEKLKTSGTWRELLVFGIENKIVTSSTAFIVLERIEDYIRYRIEPPKELEDQCRELNYVYSTTHRKKEIMLNSITEPGVYDLNRLQQKASWANVKRPLPASGNGKTTIRSEAIASTASGTATQQPIKMANTGKSAGDNTIAEVVVTSAFNTKRTVRSVASNVQTVRAEELNVVRGTDINNALAGKVAGLQVRSQSAAALGRSATIRLRGENTLSNGVGALYVVNGTVMPSSNEINPDDIEDITVLQGPAATALFGPEGGNGAIVINTKKAKRNYSYYNHSWPYRLSDVEDIEYLEEIKKAGRGKFLAEYKRQKINQVYNPAFYLDVAELFYKNNFKKEARQVLDEGIEMGAAHEMLLQGAAYILESWGEFLPAIELYKQAISNNSKNAFLQKDLALCYFQAGQYQLALNSYLKILNEESYYYSYNLKQLVLNEINALISLHRYQLDLSKVHPSVIKDYPADLYITMGSNSVYESDFTIGLPGGATIGFYHNYSNKRDENLFTHENEIFIKSAYKGTYRIVESTYRGHHRPGYSRIIVFKNYQRPGQKIEIQHVQMDGQWGYVEVGTIKW